MEQRTKLFLFSLFSFFLISFSGKQNPDNHPIYLEFELKEMSFFGSPRELIDFFQFKKGETIADVGAGDGTYSAIYSLFCDSCTIYAEDISDRTINWRKLNRHVRHYTKVKGAPFSNKYKISIGTYTATNLPDGVFDKLILKASFHEFSEMTEMVNDLDKKLKPGGKIYIVEAFSYKNEIIHCDLGHRGYRIREVDSIMAPHGYFLVQMSRPESNWPNYTNILVYQKNEAASKEYHLQMDAVASWVEKSRHLMDSTIAADSVLTKAVYDSVYPHFVELKAVYPCMQHFLEDFGWRWTLEKKPGNAITVLKEYLHVFPDSYYALGSLAKAYHDLHQHALEKYYYDHSWDLYSSDRKSRTAK